MKSEEEVKKRLKELLKNQERGDGGTQELRWVLDGWWPDDEWVNENVHGGDDAE